MDQNTSIDELKDRLNELIKSSPSIKSLPEKQREAQIQTMMNSSAEKMKEFIKILEDEQEYTQNVENEFQQHADEVNAYYEEVKDVHHEKERAELRQKESKELKVAQSKASDLIQKLEEVTKEEKPVEKKKVKKSKFVDLFKGKLTLMKFVRGTLAALIGSILCGLAGILIIFAIVFAMGKYVKLDVVYSMEPSIAFNAYWFALIYGALIGLFLIPLLRLIKKKSFFISLLFGGVIGALLIALSHMAFGLDNDILLLQNSNPIHIRGYWVAIGFAVIVGFLGQFAYRLINLGEFFNLTSDEK